jgi:hypothetical protein
MMENREDEASNNGSVGGPVANRESILSLTCRSLPRCSNTNIYWFHGVTMTTFYGRVIQHVNYVHLVRQKCDLQGHFKTEHKILKCDHVFPLAGSKSIDMLVLFYSYLYQNH